MTGVLTVGTWPAVSWIATTPDLALSTSTALFGGGTLSVSCSISPSLPGSLCSLLNAPEGKEESGVRKEGNRRWCRLPFPARTYRHGDPLARRVVVSLDHGLGEPRVVVGGQVVVRVVAPVKVAKGIRRVSATVSTACLTGRVACRSDHGERQEKKKQERRRKKKEFSSLSFIVKKRRGLLPFRLGALYQCARAWAARCVL